MTVYKQYVQRGQNMGFASRSTPGVSAFYFTLILISKAKLIKLTMEFGVKISHLCKVANHFWE